MEGELRSSRLDRRNLVLGTSKGGVHRSKKKTSGTGLLIAFNHRSWK